MSTRSTEHRNSNGSNSSVSGESPCGLWNSSVVVGSVDGVGKDGAIGADDVGGGEGFTDIVVATIGVTPACIVDSTACGDWTSRC